MADRSEFAMTSDEEPLLVLRYRRFGVYGLTIFYVLLVPFFVAEALFSLRSLSGFLIAPLSALFIRGIIAWTIGVLAFKEIRLYNNRIVQVRNWGLAAVEVELANAKLWVMMREGLMRVKRIYSGDMEIRRGWGIALPLPRSIIVYDEELAALDNVKRFNCLLAYLSGRKTKELEENLDKLIKEGTGPRIVTKDTLAEVLLRMDDPNQAAFDRTYNIALFGLAITMGVLFLFVMWLNFR